MTQDTSILHAKAIFGMQCVLIGRLSELYRDIFVTVLQKCIKRVAVGPHSLGFVVARLRSKAPNWQTFRATASTFPTFMSRASCAPTNAASSAFH